MDQYTALFTIGSVLSFVGTFLFFIAALILFIRKRTPATILVFVGSLLLLLLFGFGILAPILAARRGSEDLLWVNGFITVARGFSYLTLSIGILILVMDIKKAD
ncbi:MAG: hypothetical protein KJO77_01530 [Bacteroidia bacterium]|nr:hypothetical protein [Bacteroidia bacterium]